MPFKVSVRLFWGWILAWWFIIDEDLHQVLRSELWAKASVDTFSRGGSAILNKSIVVCLDQGSARGPESTLSNLTNNSDQAPSAFCISIVDTTEKPETTKFLLLFVNGFCSRICVWNHVKLWAPHNMQWNPKPQGILSLHQKHQETPWGVHQVHHVTILRKKGFQIPLSWIRQVDDGLVPSSAHLFCSTFRLWPVFLSPTWPEPCLFVALNSFLIACYLASCHPPSSATQLRALDKEGLQPISYSADIHQISSSQYGSIHQDPSPHLPRHLLSFDNSSGRSWNCIFVDGKAWTSHLKDEFRHMSIHPGWWLVHQGVRRTLERPNIFLLLQPTPDHDKRKRPPEEHPKI